MSVVATYNSSQVVVTADGVRLDGVSVVIADDNDMYEVGAGVDGAAYRSFNNARTGTVTLQAPYGREAHVLLHGFRRRGLQGLDDKFELVCSEVLSGSRFVATAWVNSGVNVPLEATIADAQEVTLAYGGGDWDPEELP
jgi:hypothetical protein